LQARNSTSKERNSVLTRNKKWCEQKPGKVKKNVSFKKDPKYYDPNTKMLRFLMAETQRTTRRVLNQRPKRSAQVHAPSFIRVRSGARGREERRGRKRESDTGSVRGTPCNLSRFSFDPRAAAFHRCASCEEEESCVLHDSITIL